MGISLCMIVKNEENWVDGAVQSVRSIVNEVIIVDTGSTDATLERLKPFGALRLGVDTFDVHLELGNVRLAVGETRARETNTRNASKRIPTVGLCAKRRS